jgi:hypothetical protein
MTNIVGRVVVALVAGLAALAAWGESSRLDHDAAVWQRLAVLANDVPDPVPRSGVMRLVPAALGSEAAAPGQQKATGDYWLARHDDLVRTRGGDPDPAVMHTAANAAYRVARRAGEVGTGAAGRLDAVLEAYAAVLKADGDHPDAAWNYEFVARTRDILARARLAGPRRASPTSPGLTPPPAKLTVHGLPGAPPPDVKGEEFETIAPMDYGDREAQPEPTPGTTIKRKG